MHLHSSHIRSQWIMQWNADVFEWHSQFILTKASSIQPAKQKEGWPLGERIFLSILISDCSSIKRPMFSFCLLCTYSFFQIIIIIFLLFFLFNKLVFSSAFHPLLNGFLFGTYISATYNHQTESFFLLLIFQVIAEIDIKAYNNTDKAAMKQWENKGQREALQLFVKNKLIYDAASLSANVHLIFTVSPQSSMSLIAF